MPNWPTHRAIPRGGMLELLGLLPTAGEKYLNILAKYEPQDHQHEVAH